MKHKSIILSLGLICLLQACGGGSGGGDRDTDRIDEGRPVNDDRPVNGDVSDLTVQVNASNYDDYAKTVQNAMQRDPVGQGDGGSNFTPQSLTQVSFKHTLKKKIAIKTLPAAVENCEAGGTMNLDTAFPMQKKGDSVTLFYNNCNLGDGVILNGEITIELLADADEAAEAFSVFQRIEFKNYSERNDLRNETFSINGPMTSDIYFSFARESESTTYENTTIEFNGETITYGNFVESFEREGSIVTETYDGNMAFDGKGEFAGQFVIETKTPLKMDLNDMFAGPYEGLIEMRSGNAVIREVFKGDSIELSFDEDGDGRPEDTRVENLDDFLVIDFDKGDWDNTDDVDVPGKGDDEPSDTKPLPGDDDGDSDSGNGNGGNAGGDSDDGGDSDSDDGDSDSDGNDGDIEDLYYSYDGLPLSQARIIKASQNRINEYVAILLPESDKCLLRSFSYTTERAAFDYAVSQGGVTMNISGTFIGFLNLNKVMMISINGETQEKTVEFFPGNLNDLGDPSGYDKCEDFKEVIVVDNI